MQFHFSFGYSLLTLIASISTQYQMYSVYFGLSTAFDIVPHNILLQKLRNFGLSSRFVDWFHSYLDNRHSSVRISVMLLFSYLLESGVPQGSTLGPLIFR
jgi:hypothetical protein